MARKKKRHSNWKNDVKFELYGMGIIILSVITLAEWGAVGRSLRYMFRFIVGTWDFIMPPIFIGLALYIMVKRHWPKGWSIRSLGGFLLLLSILIISHVQLFPKLTNEGDFEVNIVKQTFQLIWEERNSQELPIGGGLVGAFFFMIFYYLFGFIGAQVTAFFLFIISVMFLTGVTFEKIYNWMVKVNRKVTHWLHYKWREVAALFRYKSERRKSKAAKRLQALTDSDPEEDEEITTVPEPTYMEQEPPVIHDFTQKAYENQMGQQEMEEKRENTFNQNVVYSMENMDYKLPSYNLLDKAKKSSIREHRDIANNAQKLEQTLKSFGVHARVLHIHRGPAVTRYEVQPDTGVKVSRVVSLTDDLALALAAKDIRMEAPIPGKSVIGIEVPNEEVALVTLREVLESSNYHESPSKLTLALGRDISGEPIIGDLTKMPHLLVAGATGSGKSVCINGIIASILYKAKPHEVKFMMIDPKMVELNIYNGIPHLLVPVVTDPRKASIALRKAVAEMEKRYELFAQIGAKDIERYNQIIYSRNKEENHGHPLPYIVVIVDELADLMMVSPADVEDSITRLAQKARAAGIHLILATQRPSVDVITGIIKANIPSRIAFGVSSQVDSRTILDMAGAEKLLGKGDMLYLPVGSSKATRIQGCFVTDHEIEALVKAVKSQQKADYHEDMIPNDKHEEVAQIDDEYYERAVELVTENQTASVSLLQRRFRIGYARAARLIDMMEQNGIVGPYEGSKPREVRVGKKENTNIS